MIRPQTISEKIKMVIRKYNKKTDLIISEKFLVDHVLSESKIVQVDVDFTQRGELGGSIAGGKYFDDLHNESNTCYETDGGMHTIYQLQVQPLRKDCPIRTLTFDGPNPLVLGDMIIEAKIYKGVWDGEIEFNFGASYPYAERPLEEKESALELSLTNGSGKIIHTARSPDYKKYFDDSLFK